jgi:hypothetical protein
LASPCLSRNNFDFPVRSEIATSSNSTNGLFL